MKILHVCETAQGGVGTHINELVSLQIKSSVSNKIMLLAPREHLIQLPDVPSEIIRTFKRPSRIRGLFDLAFQFVSTVFLFKPDVIHIHSSVAGFVIRPLASLWLKPIVYCPHGWAMDRDQSRHSAQLIGFVEYLLSFLTSRIIAVSESEKMRGMQVGIPSKKLVKIYNGIKAEPPAFQAVQWDDSRLKVLFVGRFDRQKGIDVLLNAVAGLQDVICVRVLGNNVVGEDPVSFADYPHVEPLGWLNLSSVSAQMAVCDVVVMPSRWEGLPIVGIEAMRMKKPIIATRVGGVPELVEDGATGYLFDSGDDEALASLLIKAERDKLRQMGEYAHTVFLKSFVSDKMVSAVDGVYTEINRGLK